MRWNLWLAIGAINAFLAVAAGAFGAHSLKQRISADMLAVFETGARYHMYHALALLAVAWISDRGSSGMVSWAGWSFLLGIVLFSGSLYALSLTGVKTLGAITPLGGASMLIGWALLAWAAIK